MDVIQLAKDKRLAYAKEIAKLDEFIALGERLVSGAPGATDTPTAPRPDPSGSGEKPLTLREVATASGGAKP